MSEMNLTDKEWYLMAKQATATASQTNTLADTLSLKISKEPDTASLHDQILNSDEEDEQIEEEEEDEENLKDLSISSLSNHNNINSLPTPPVSTASSSTSLLKPNETTTVSLQSIKSFNCNNTINNQKSKQQQQQRQLQPVSNSLTGNGNTYELSNDLKQKEIEILNRKYGGHLRARRAARVIQLAYRQYKLKKNYEKLFENNLRRRSIDVVMLNNKKNNESQETFSKISRTNRTNSRANFDLASVDFEHLVERIENENLNSININVAHFNDSLSLFYSTGTENRNINYSNVAATCAASASLTSTVLTVPTR